MKKKRDVLRLKENKRPPYYTNYLTIDFGGSIYRVIPPFDAMHIASWEMWWNDGWRPVTSDVLRKGLWATFIETYHRDAIKDYEGEDENYIAHFFKQLEAKQAKILNQDTI